MASDKVAKSCHRWVCSGVPRVEALGPNPMGARSLKTPSSVVKQRTAAQSTLRRGLPELAGRAGRSSLATSMG